MRFHYPAHVIHLDTLKDRVGHIRHLQNTMDFPITIFNASDGSQLWNSDTIPKKHPVAGQVMTQGGMGCTKSHLDIIERAYTDNTRPAQANEAIYIFEDDVEPLLPAEYLNSLLTDISKLSDDNWDIILLGATEYVSAKPITHQINRVNRFWGTHAMLIRGRVFKYIHQTFIDSLKEGIFLPADWLYNEAIRKYMLNVYGPANPKTFFRQIPGVISAITGKVRT